MIKRQIGPIHPGVLLLEEFLRPSQVSQYRLARDAGMSRIQVSEIVRGRRSITAETALRLGRFFGMSPEFWLNAQAHYDLLVTEAKLSKTLAKEVLPLAATGMATA